MLDTYTDCLYVQEKGKIVENCRGNQPNNQKINQVAESSQYVFKSVFYKWIFIFSL